MWLQEATEQASKKLEVQALFYHCSPLLGLFCDPCLRGSLALSFSWRWGMGCAGQRTPLRFSGSVFRTVLPQGPPSPYHAHCMLRSPLEPQARSIQVDIHQPQELLRTLREPPTYQVVHWSSHRILRPFPSRQGTDSAPSSSLHRAKSTLPTAALGLAPADPDIYLPNSSSLRTWPVPPLP